MRPIGEQTVLVTGATSGLGQHLVQRLAAGGATVIAHGRDTQRLHRTREQIRAATGREVDTVQADLADLAQVHRLADEVLDRYPQLHALVNNAGVGFGAPGAGREVSADGIELRSRSTTWPVTCWPGGWPTGWLPPPRPASCRLPPLASWHWIRMIHSPSTITTVSPRTAVRSLPR